MIPWPWGPPPQPSVGANPLTSERQAEVFGNPQAWCVKLLVCHQRDKDAPTEAGESQCEASGGAQPLTFSHRRPSTESRRRVSHNRFGL